MNTSAFSTLYRLADNQYTKGCPLILKAGALLRHDESGQILAQLKFESCSTKRIAAVLIELKLIDVMQRDAGSLEYTYLDLDIYPHQDFGNQTPILINNKQVRHYGVIIRQVVFKDESIWCNHDGATTTCLPNSKRLSLSSEHLAQFRRSMAESSLTYAVQVYGDLWQCGCGKWNVLDEMKCYNCHCNRLQQEQLAHEETLQPLLDAYHLEQKRQQEELDKLKLELANHEALKKVEQSKLESSFQEQQTQKARIKKRNKILAASSVALIALMVVLCTQVVLPHHYYNKGYKQLDNKQYDLAYDSFLQAGNYQDAPVLAQQAATELGNSYMAEMKYKHAQEAYEKAANAIQAELAKKFQRAATARRFSSVVYLQDRVDLPASTFAYTYEGQKYGFLGIGTNKWATDAIYTYVTVDGDILLLKSNEKSSPYTVVDTKRGTVVHLNGIEQASFSENMLKVKTQNNLYGWFDYQGNVVIDCQYEDARDFSEGLAAVQKNGLWGYINYSGETMIDFQFHKAESMQEGYAKVYMNKRYVKQNNLYQELPAGYGIINCKGEVCVTPQWDDVVMKGYIHEGVVKVIKKNGSSSETWRYGLVDLNDSVRLQAIWTDMGEFAQGLLYVRILNAAHYPCAQAGYVNSAGKMVINLVAMGIDGVFDGEEFENGLARITAWIPNSNKKSRNILDNLVDMNGKLIFDTWQDRYIDWTDETHFRWYEVGKQNGKTDYYHYANGIVTKTSMTANAASKTSASAFMKQWGYVYPYTEEGIALVSLGSEKSVYGPIVSSGPYGYITEDEQLLVEPIYSNAKSFSNGLAAVEINGLWGYINTEGYIVIQPQYSEVQSFSKGNAFVAQNGKYYLIDTTGKVLLSGFEPVEGYFHQLEFTNGYCVIKKNTQCQVITHNGIRVY